MRISELLKPKENCDKYCISKIAINKIVARRKILLKELAKISTLRQKVQNSYEQCTNGLSERLGCWLADKRIPTELQDTTVLGVSYSDQYSVLSKLPQVSLKEMQRVASDINALLIPLEYLNKEGVKKLPQGIQILLDAQVFQNLLDADKYFDYDIYALCPLNLYSVYNNITAVEDKFVHYGKGLSSTMDSVSLMISPLRIMQANIEQNSQNVQTLAKTMERNIFSLNSKLLKISERFDSFETSVESRFLGLENSIYATVDRYAKNQIYPMLDKVAIKVGYFRVDREGNAIPTVDDGRLQQLYYADSAYEEYQTRAVAKYLSATQVDKEIYDAWHRNPEYKEEPIVGPKHTPKAKYVSDMSKQFKEDLLNGSVTADMKVNITSELKWVRYTDMGLMLFAVPKDTDITTQEDITCLIGMDYTNISDIPDFKPFMEVDNKLLHTWSFKSCETKYNLDSLLWDLTNKESSHYDYLCTCEEVYRYLLGIKADSNTVLYIPNIQIYNMLAYISTFYYKDRRYYDAFKTKNKNEYNYTPVYNGENPLYFNKVCESDVGVCLNKLKDPATGIYYFSAITPTENMSVEVMNLSDFWYITYYAMILGDYLQNNTVDLFAKMELPLNSDFIQDSVKH